MMILQPVSQVFAGADLVLETKSDVTFEEATVDECPNSASIICSFMDVCVVNYSQGCDFTKSFGLLDIARLPEERCNQFFSDSYFQYVFTPFDPLLRPPQTV